jgi:type I restriction enzyme S subunit
VVRGSSPRPIADQRYFVGGTIPWIKIADATKSGRYLYDTREKVNEFGASFSRLLPKGSLIVAASGTLGYTQMLGVPGCIHDGWLHLSNFRGVETLFLYYWLKCQVEYFTSSAYGAAIQNINTAIMRESTIDLPPLASQHRIASILSAYDDLIENNTRRIAILEEIARRIYEEWFVRFRFPGHEDVRMVESELGLVPVGWMVATLGQLAEVNARSVRRGAEPTEIQYVDISSVSTGSIDNKEPMLFSDAPGRARRIVRDGDVIWACVRPNRKSYALVLSPERNLIVSTGFAVLSPIAAPWSFLYHCVTTDDFVSYLVNHAKGAAYPAVGAEDFENAKILRPTNDVVLAFDRVAEPMMRLVAGLHAKNSNLRTTRDLLLPKLISGELDISALPEPKAIAA